MVDLPPYPCGYPWECDEDCNYTHAHFTRITSACACASVKGAGKVLHACYGGTHDLQGCQPYRFTGILPILELLLPATVRASVSPLISLRCATPRCRRDSAHARPRPPRACMNDLCYTCFLRAWASSKSIWPSKPMLPIALAIQPFRR